MQDTIARLKETIHEQQKKLNEQTEKLYKLGSQAHEKANNLEKE